MYTLSFLKDEDITIEHIKSQLNRAVKMINVQNKLNLTDINIICEEIFGKVLNKVYELKLKSVFAEHKPYYAAIDLYDEDAGIAFQITTQKDRRKIKETITKFINKEIYHKFNKIYFLILNEPCKHDWDRDDVELFESIDFSDKNILYIKDLVDLIINKEQEQKEKQKESILPSIYSLINMVFDSGRLKYKSIVKLSEEYEEEHRIESFDFDLYTCGFSDVRVNLIVPTYNIDDFACSIEFLRSEISGVILWFDLKTLISNYFLDEQEFLNKHCKHRNINCPDTLFYLENLKFHINANTAYHIYLLFKKIEDEYKICKNNIKNNMSVD